MKDKIKPYYIEIDPSWVVFVNGFKAKSFMGFIWLWFSLLSIIKTTKNARGCSLSIPAVVSPLEVIMISYWDNKTSLNEFVRSKPHMKFMHFVYRNPNALSLFNETYQPDKSGLYFNSPMGMSKITKYQKP